MDFFITRIFPAIIFGGIGLYIFLIMNANIRQRNSIKGWSKTHATIVSSSFEERKAQRFSRYTGGYKVKYSVPMIQYSYQVLGIAYQSRGYHNTAESSYQELNEDERSRILAEYPPGKVVTITYNPDNPGEAYLLPETSIIGPARARVIGFCLMVIALIWVGWGAYKYVENNVNKRVADQQLVSSSGLLPVASNQINTNLAPLATKYNLECRDETFGGTQLVYQLHTCETQTGNDLGRVVFLSSEKCTILTSKNVPLEWLHIKN
jgi:hypothetical protein